MKRQCLQVVRAWIVLHNRQLVGGETQLELGWKLFLGCCFFLICRNINRTLASLKLSSRASRLAPTSCTLAMDITLPKREKDATCSSFSFRALESAEERQQVAKWKWMHYLSLHGYKKRFRSAIPVGLSDFEELWKETHNKARHKICIFKRLCKSEWRRDYLDIVDDPVHEELGCPSHHQVLLLAGDKVAVDWKLHRGGSVSLSVHRVHRGGETSASDKTGNMLR